MALEGVTWRPEDVSADIAAQWDAMASGRGTQADVYSSHAWLRAVLDGRPGLARDVAIPAVLRDGVPVALLPLRRHGWTWGAAHADHGPRFRPVLETELPDPETMAELVDQAGRSGVRELVLPGLPTRDPATAGLVEALRGAGFVVEQHQKRTDNVVPVADDPEAYERNTRKLVTSSRPRERRVTPFWDLEVTAFGGDGGPIEEGLDRFEAVSAESWKGSRRQAAQRTRQALLTRADERGWVRLLMLTISGRPAAGNIYFRLGEVFCGWNTVYDQRLAVLSPGQILHRYVQEEVHAEPPALLDLLPGDNPFKEAMKVHRPPLVTVAAHRPGLLRSASLPVRRWSREELPGARHRTQMRLVQARNRLRTRRATAPAETRSRITPGSPAPAGTVVEVEPTAPLQRYLAVVHGLSSATAVASRWPDARWFHVTLDPDRRALVRLTPPGEDEADPGAAAGVAVVPLVSGTDARLVAQALAGHLDAPVDLVQPRGASPVATEGDLPVLPWTPALVGEGQPRARGG